MAVPLLGLDDDGHPLTGRVPAQGVTVVLYVGAACAIRELAEQMTRDSVAAAATLVVVDVDVEPMTGQHFHVRVLPTWHVWVDGRLKAARTGAVGPDDLAAMARR